MLAPIFCCLGQSLTLEHVGGYICVIKTFRHVGKYAYITKALVPIFQALT
jgi:hypothetical protein